MGCDLLTIGILPTVRRVVVLTAHVTQVRYQSLNDRVIALRDGSPIEIGYQW